MKDSDRPEAIVPTLEVLFGSQGPQDLSDDAMELPVILNDVFYRALVHPDGRALDQYFHIMEQMLPQQASIQELFNKCKNDIIAMRQERKERLRPVMEKIPPEIFVAIFSFVCDDPHLNTLSRQFLPSAMALSSVCKRWNDIVLSTPSLWSYLSVFFYTWKSNWKQLDQIVSLFLARSRSAPLSLDLDLMCHDGYPPNDEEAEMCVAILGNIVQHSDRWQTVELTISPDGLGHPVLQPFVGRLPILQKLKLIGFEELDMIDYDTGFPVDTLFRECPSLEHISINGSMLESPPVLPWQQIRTLEVQDMYDLPTLKSALSKCPNVENLYLNEIELFREPEKELIELGPPMHSVKYLSIEYGNVLDVASAFYYLHLPGLVSVRLSGYWDGRMYDLKYLYIESFLQRSSCSITSLWLKYVSISDQDTVSLLQMIPTLERLCVEEQHHEREGLPQQRVVTTLFWDSISIATSSSRILPRLKELDLTFHGDELDVDALRKALLSRCNPELDASGTCLWRVTLQIIGVGFSKRSDLVDIERGFKLKRTMLSIIYL